MPILAPQELLDYTSRVVLVTGAGQGIGAGIALRFAEAGASVVVHYRNSKSEAERVIAKIQAGGGKAMGVQADVTQRAEVERLVQETVAAFGRLDVLVNNAGIYPLASLVEMTDDEWNETIQANLTSVFLCTQIATRQMIAQGAGGAIVNIASIEAENPAPYHSHYNAAKAGVVMHARAAAHELGEHGIRVNAVSPGLIWRDGLEQNWPDGVERYLKAAPLKRLGMADDIGDACLFLASPAARWITGANLVVDGGVMTKQIY